MNDRILSTYDYEREACEAAQQGNDTELAQAVSNWHIALSRVHDSHGVDEAMIRAQVVAIHNCENHLVAPLTKAAIEETIFYAERAYPENLHGAIDAICMAAQAAVAIHDQNLQLQTANLWEKYTTEQPSLAAMIDSVLAGARASPDNSGMEGSLFRSKVEAWARKTLTDLDTSSDPKLPSKADLVKKLRSRWSDANSFKL